MQIFSPVIVNEKKKKNQETDIEGSLSLSKKPNLEAKEAPYPPTWNLGLFDLGLFIGGKGCFRNFGPRVAFSVNSWKVRGIYGNYPLLYKSFSKGSTPIRSLASFDLRHCLLLQFSTVLSVSLKIFDFLFVCLRFPSFIYQMFSLSLSLESLFLSSFSPFTFSHL